MSRIALSAVAFAAVARAYGLGDAILLAPLLWVLPRLLPSYEDEE